jgi:hypothetical protein
MAQANVTLACTWFPRGEMPRFERMCRMLSEVYSEIVIATPQVINPGDLDYIRSLATRPNIHIVVSPGPAHSRDLSLQRALDTSATYIHYADMDRLLRWVETRPQEWRQTVEALQASACLIIGRTEAALRTHPQSMQLTERLINQVFAHVLGRTFDLCAGSRGFIRAAAQFVVAHSTPGRWSDAEWAVLLHRAGFELDQTDVNGLDWETADRYRSHAADADTQRQLATEYDRDPNHWALRVKIAIDTIDAGLAAMQQPLPDAPA